MKKKHIHNWDYLPTVHLYNCFGCGMLMNEDEAMDRLNQLETEAAVQRKAASDATYRMYYAFNKINRLTRELSHEKTPCNS